MGVSMGCAWSAARTAEGVCIAIANPVRARLRDSGSSCMVGIPTAQLEDVRLHPLSLHLSRAVHLASLGRVLLQAPHERSGLHGTGFVIARGLSFIVFPGVWATLEFLSLKHSNITYLTCSSLVPVQ